MAKYVCDFDQVIAAGDKLSGSINFIFDSIISKLEIERGLLDTDILVEVIDETTSTNDHIKNYLNRKEVFHDNF